jgi:hypothetical protein
MDPEKPKSDSTGEPASDRLSAEQRVERLSGRDREQKDEPPTRSSADKETVADGRTGSRRAKGEPAGKTPVLTERQRREAREQRRKGGRSRKRGTSATGSAGSGRGPRAAGGNPLSRGVRATLVELRRTAGFFRALILTGLDRLGPAVRWLTAGLLALFSAAGRALSGLGRLLARASHRLGKAVAVVDRVLTPRRALTTVVAAGIVTLVASQFLDFRAAEVGQAAYDPIQDITRAPRIDVLTPIDAHSFLLLAVALLALGGLIGAAVTGRRALFGLTALAGLLTVAVTLLIDLPKGLDIEVAEISYSGVVAVLLSGFWTQLAAGFVLAVGGLGLLALSGQRSTARARRGGAESGSGRERGRRGNGHEPIDAGGLT